MAPTHSATDSAANHILAIATSISALRTPRTMVDFAAWGHNVGCCLQFDRRFSPLLLRPLLRSKL
jgi:hypothetical protein